MISVASIVLLVAVEQASSTQPNLAAFFHAIRMVETGGEEQPEDAIGDGGKSLGPYQISRKYHLDSGVAGEWQRCRERKYSEAVMLRYWKRHCPDALRTRDYETLARIHNGGPNGHKKSATQSYWRLVQGILKAEKMAARNQEKQGRVCASDS